MKKYLLKVLSALIALMLLIIPVNTNVVSATETYEYNTVLQNLNYDSAQKQQHNRYKFNRQVLKKHERKKNVFNWIKNAVKGLLVLVPTGVMSWGGYNLFDNFSEVKSIYCDTELTTSQKFERICNILFLRKSEVKSKGNPEVVDKKTEVGEDTNTSIPKVEVKDQAEVTSETKEELDEKADLSEEKIENQNDGNNEPKSENKKISEVEEPSQQEEITKSFSPTSMPSIPQEAPSAPTNVPMMSSTPSASVVPTRTTTTVMPTASATPSSLVNATSCTQLPTVTPSATSSKSAPTAVSTMTSTPSTSVAPTRTTTTVVPTASATTSSLVNATSCTQLPTVTPSATSSKSAPTAVSAMSSTPSTSVAPSSTTTIVMPTASATPSSVINTKSSTQTPSATDVPVTPTKVGQRLNDRLRQQLLHSDRIKAKV